jgi:dienelactone hydrolase
MAERQILRRTVWMVILTPMVLLNVNLCAAAGQHGPGRHKITFTSSYDSTAQPAYIIVPKSLTKDTIGVPLLVALHTWSANYQQREMFGELEREAARRGWLYLFPDFRGTSDHPLGCGSEAACRDIIDAVDWTLSQYHVDKSRIYLAGFSGGGFMTMLMITRFPGRWTAASAWGGISDLAAWYEFQKDKSYGTDLRNCFGGSPSESDDLAKRYRERSPSNSLGALGDFALDIAAGRFDGHGSNPVSLTQSIGAFNAIARARGAQQIDERETEEIAKYDGVLLHPQPQDTATDPVFKRKILLRRSAGAARVTIFDGGHEWIPRAVMAWFDAHPGKKR